MKYLSKAIVSLGILYFVYKILTIDVFVAITLGWIVIPIGVMVIYEIMSD